MIKTQRRKDTRTLRKKVKILKTIAPLRLCAFALKKYGLIAFVLAFAVFLPGCVGGKKVPNLDAIFAQSKLRKGKRPVIITHGILGIEHVNADTKDRFWINLSNAKTDGLSLPVSPDLAKNRDNLVATRIIERAKISAFLPEVSIYEALIQSMERYG